MTAPPSSSPPPPAAAPRRRLRSYLLDTFVTALAVLSLATWSFHLWIDLRFARSIVMTVLPVLWSVTVLVIPLLLRRPARDVVVIRVLLWPTYLLLICAFANSIYYYRLLAQDRIDAVFPVIPGLLDQFFSLFGMKTGFTRYTPPLPTCAWVGLVLFAWTVSVRRRAAAPLPRMSPARRLFALVSGAAVTAAVGWFIYLNTYEAPPAGPVDVAVVLGNRVLPDGRASVVLEDRTLAAVDLYKRGLAKKILVSGMIEPMPDGLPAQSEVVAMKNVCLARGVPEDDILMDPVGVNTRATAYNTLEFMRRNNLHTVAGVSHAFHLPRVRMSFKEVGVAAAAVRAKPTEWVQPDLNETIRETIGIVTYAVTPSYRPAKAVEMNVRNPRLVVTKSKGTVELFERDRLVKTYTCITGSGAGDKQVEGDRKTPVGSFRIVFKNPESKFHLSLGLNYPDEHDAKWGLEQGKITREQYDMIVRMHALTDLSKKEDQERYWKTPLGGEIFIHGHGTGRSGTAGCVAVSDEDIEELYAVCPLGTPVEIRP